MQKSIWILPNVVYAIVWSFRSHWIVYYFSPSSSSSSSSSCIQCCVLCAWRFVVFLNALQQHMSKLGRAKHTKTMMMMWRYDDMKVSRLVRLPFFPFSRTMLLCLIQGMLAHIHIQWRIIHGKYCHCTPRSVKIVKTLKTLHINAYHRKQHYWSNAMCALKIQTQSTPKRGDNS